jgi:hypoxanthine phosphoribosyltransferase
MPEGLELAGRDVLLVEDIVDTGRSLLAIRRRIEERGPRSVTTVALLDKRSRREVGVEPDLAGFEVPDEFLVGYGLDYAGRYRNLPYVGVLRREAYEDVP